MAFCLGARDVAQCRALMRPWLQSRASKEEEEKKKEKEEGAEEVGRVRRRGKKEENKKRRGRKGKNCFEDIWNNT